jgi:hypothetical protein
LVLGPIEGLTNLEPDPLQLSEEIEDELGLWKGKVPKVRGKCRINAG